MKRYSSGRIRRGGRGFTILEMLVVVVVIAVIAMMAMPQYQKSVESSKADDAVSTLQIIATTNRLYNVDNAGYAVGPLNNCTGGAACGSAPGTACELMNCQYMVFQNFGQKGYNFQGANGAVSGTDPCGLGASAGFYVACAKRKVCPGDPPPCASGAPYTGWGYTVDVNGVTQRWPNTASGPPLAPS